MMLRLLFVPWYLQSTWIFSCLMLLSCGLLLFLFIREKQNKRKLLSKTRENEALVREIQHRVRNNLQLIHSLLRLQSAHVDNLEARKILELGEHRVKSMSLIHQKQVQKDEFVGVEMKDYLQQLSASIFQSIGQKTVSVQTLNKKPICLDLDTAIPLGLLINELLHLSANGSHPGSTSQSPGISLQIESPAKLTLSLQLNPLPPQSDWPDVSKRLIELLLIQLDANMNIDWESTQKIQITIHEFNLLKLTES